MESVNDEPLETPGSPQQGDPVAVAQPELASWARLWQRLDAEGRELLYKITLRMLGVSYNTGRE